MKAARDELEQMVGPEVGPADYSVWGSGDGDGSFTEDWAALVDFCRSPRKLLGTALVAGLLVWLLIASHRGWH